MPTGKEMHARVRRPPPSLTSLKPTEQPRTVANSVSSWMTAPRSLAPGMSAAVYTPTTPGTAIAAAVSTDSSLACGRWEGTSTACSAPAGSGMSSTYCASPDTCMSAAWWR